MSSSLKSFSCLLVLSSILPTVLSMLPGSTAFNDEGMVNLRSNVSESSEIMSLVTDTLIIVILVPAGKVAVIGVEM